MIPDQIKGDNEMDLHAVVRIINGLKAAGWDDKAILDFVLWVVSGEEKYIPKIDNIRV